MNRKGNVKILTDEIEKRIQTDVIDNILKREYDLAINNIAIILAALHSNIPESKRISYGKVYTVKVLSEDLYKYLVQVGAPVHEVAVEIFKMDDYFEGKCVSLGILSLYGLENTYNYKKVLPHFKAAADHENWEVREFAATFFQKYITRYPDEVRDYFLHLVESEKANLRRFVSETLRPVTNNKWFYKNPEYPLFILRKMFRESSPYPRTSVGNNLSDLARRLPDLVLGLVKELVESGDKNSYWIAYRACRNLVKKEPIKVMDLLQIEEYKYKKAIYKRSDYQGS